MAEPCDQSLTASSTSPAPCSVTALRSIPRWPPKNPLVKRWGVPPDKPHRLLLEFQRVPRPNQSCHLKPSKADPTQSALGDVFRGQDQRNRFPHRAKIAGADHRRVALDRRCGAGGIAPCARRERDSVARHPCRPFLSRFLRDSFRKGTAFRWSFYRRPHPRTQRPRQAVHGAVPVDTGRSARARRSDLGRRDSKSFRTAQDYRTYGAHPSQTYCGKNRHAPAGGTREIVLRDDDPRSGVCKTANYPWLARGSKSLIS
jgi:hypothetical protein